MKPILICFLTILLLFSASALVMADILRVEPEISYDNLRIEGGTPQFSISEPGLSVGLNGGADLGLFRLGVELGYGRTKNFSFLTVTPRAGWEFSILDYRFKVYEAYRNLNLTGVTSLTTTYDFSGFVFETGIESKISEMFAWTGALTIPETGSYHQNGVLIKEGVPGIFRADWSIGLKFSPLPLYDILVEYHATDLFEKDQNLKIGLSGVTASINITY